MRSSRIHIVGLLSMIEPIVKSPIFHLRTKRENHRPWFGRWRDRVREREKERGKERDPDREDSIDITRCNELVSREGASTTRPVLFQAR